MRDLESWRHDQIVSEAEYDGIRKRYERLIEREDAWIMEARRLTLPQVTLYLGAWVLAVGAAFLTLLLLPGTGRGARHCVGLGRGTSQRVAGHPQLDARQFPGGDRVSAGLLPGGADRRAGHRAGSRTLHRADTRARSSLELFHRLEFAKQATNAQLWWALLAALPVCWWLRRFTRAPVFSLMFATYAALLCLATLLRMGMLDWLDHDPGRFYFHLLPCAAALPGRGLRVRTPRDCRTTRATSIPSR